VGKPCLDIRRYNSTANKTLNFLVGIDGLKYANIIIDGACDTLKFLRGFSDALRTIDPQTERPVIEVGDVIVIDNCPTHHGEVYMTYVHCLKRHRLTLTDTVV
jgi:hypothetical protein